MAEIGYHQRSAFRRGENKCNEHLAGSDTRVTISRGRSWRYSISTIFISHPYSSSPKWNCLQVAKIARRLALEGHLPLAPQLMLPHFVDEFVERDLALKLCLGLVALADEVRVYDEPSEGMRLEIAEAERLGIPVVKGELP
jgi:hypothetical protein